MFKYLALFLLMMIPGAFASDGCSILGNDLGLMWGLPFVGILFSIALFPVLLPNVWHKHFATISFVWILIFLIPAMYVFDFDVLFYSVKHVFFDEYFPFIIFLFGLFVISGGILIHTNLKGTPGQNLTVIGIGTVLASFIGTTGASVLLIRPMIKANKHRKHNIHIFVFFIFLVSNIGGTLTPLGDPPLFLGFLKGVPYAWPMKNLLWPSLMMWSTLLTLFYMLDLFYYRKDLRPVDEFKADIAKKEPFRMSVKGKYNVVLLCLYLFVIVGSTLLPNNYYMIGDIRLTNGDIFRDVGCFGLAMISLAITPKTLYKENQFSWHPIYEVAVLFLAIFITIVPVSAMLNACEEGPLSGLFHTLFDANGNHRPAVFFWATGVLSSFLDNAPTYIVFFGATKVSVNELATTFSHVLVAISLGAVFMGANTYVGNAPNFMVKSIAENRGIKMPSFFGYMVWSTLILYPLYIVLTFILFF